MSEVRIGVQSGHRTGYGQMPPPKEYLAVEDIKGLREAAEGALEAAQECLDSCNRNMYGPRLMRSEECERRFSRLREAIDQLPRPT